MEREKYGIVSGQSFSCGLLVFDKHKQTFLNNFMHHIRQGDTMNGAQTFQQRSTGNGGPKVSKSFRRSAKYEAYALAGTEEPALDAVKRKANEFKTKADDIAMQYVIPAETTHAAAVLAARSLSGECKNESERRILANSFDVVAGIYGGESREGRFLQDVAAELRKN
jgi:hypothetical protein